MVEGDSPRGFRKKLMRGWQLLKTRLFGYNTTFIYSPMHKLQLGSGVSKNIMLASETTVTQIVS